MDGLSTANFTTGAMQGYQLMRGVDRDKKNDERMAVQDAQQNELHSLKMTAAKQDVEQSVIRTKDMNDQQAEKMNKIAARRLHYGDGISDADKQFISAYPNLDMNRLTSPEAGKHLDTIHKTLSSGGDIESFNTPEMIDTLNFMNPEVALGAKDGRKVKIRSIHAGTKPGYVMFGLDVDGDNSPNGRPLTENRSSDPKDMVKEVAIEDLIGRAEGFESYREMSLDPAKRQSFIDYYIGDEIAAKANKRVELDDKRFERESKRGLTEADINLKNAQANYYNKRETSGGGGSGGGSGSTANMKDIEYFKSLGYEPQDAVDLVINRGAAPSQEIARMAIEMVKSSNTNGEPIKMQDAMNEAAKYYNDNLRQRIKPAASAPPQTAPPAQSSPATQRPPLSSFGQ